MSEPGVIEEPLHFGEGGRLFGVLTLPAEHTRHVSRDRPVFVLLSAGLLHRVGPVRLHVRLARELAALGFSTLRVDLAGVGDSAQRAGVSNQQSVAADFEEIARVLESRLGHASMVVGGLCAGADNAIRLSLTDQRVVGLLLLDPVCFSEEGFNASAAMARFLNPSRYLAWLKRRFRAKSLPFVERWAPIDGLALRDLPTSGQIRAALEAVRDRGGRVLSVFTQYAFHNYYNSQGQLARVAKVDGSERFCTEVFWPQVEHTYMLDAHRRRLIKEVTTWAEGFAQDSRKPQ